MYLSTGSGSILPGCDPNEEKWLRKQMVGRFAVWKLVLLNTGDSACSFKTSPAEGNVVLQEKAMEQSVFGKASDFRLDLSVNDLLLSIHPSIF